MFGVTLRQPSQRPFGPLLVFGAGNNADNNPFAAKPFDEPSAFASHSPEFMFGRGSGPKFGYTQGTKPGQSTTGAGSIPSPAFETSNFPCFRSPNAPPPAFGLITNSMESDGSGTMSGSTSSHPSFGPWATSVAPAFAKTIVSSSLGQSTPFPSVSQKVAQPGFGVPGIGTRVTPYKVTNVHGDADEFGKIHSISAMPAYANRSHQELRWEDHQSENKGAARGNFNPFRIDNAVGNPFSLSNTSSWSKPTYNPFSSLSTTSAATTVSPSPSTATRPNPFSTASSPITFPSIAPPRPSSPAVPSFSSPNTTSNLATSTTTANLFPSSTTASISPFKLSLPNTFPVPNAPFSFSSPAKPSPFMAIPAPQQTTFLSFPSPAPAQTNTQSSVSSVLCPANPVGLNQSSFSIAPVQLSPPPQTTSSFDVSNPGQSPLTTTGTTGVHNIQMAQLEPVTNPFGTLPPAPQLSFDQTGTRHPIQYGISTLPVVERPARARSSSLLITTSRDLSYRQLKLPVRKYNPRNNVPKVSFFGEDVEGIALPRADALLIRRENPRDLIIRPLPEIRMLHSDDKQSRMLNEASHAAGETEDGPLEEEHDRSDPSVTFTQPAKIEVLMPKLCGSEYYTEPAIQELASKEKADPGFCSHVEGFVIGRHNYGNMRFLGETDVRGLDLNILVQFNHREVIVYAEGSSKPKVGEGLNKPAEVTLLNIKCMDKKTGQQYTEVQRVKKYGEFLKKKAEDQGARFVSYDPVKGEWKFRVDHF